MNTGRELPAHKYGELCVRGPQVMKGYMNNPTQTASTIDEAGWLHMGKLTDTCQVLLYERPLESILDTIALVGVEV